MRDNKRGLKMKFELILKIVVFVMNKIEICCSFRLLEFNVLFNNIKG